MRKVRPTKSLALVVGPLVLLAGGLSVLSFARAGANKPSPRIRPVVYSHHRLKRSHSAALDDPQAAATQILKSYGGARVLSVSVETRTARPSGSVLHFVVAADGTAEQAIRGQWESDLVAGAVADRFAGTTDKVVSTVIDVRLPNGETQDDLGGGMGAVAANQAFSDNADGVIRSNATDVLANNHLSLTSFDVLRASQPAPAVVVSTDDPMAAAAAAQETIRSLFGQDPPKYEGYYFEVRDSAGNPVLIQSAAFRTGAGRLWFSPKVADVISLNHMGGRYG